MFAFSPDRGRKRIAAEAEIPAAFENFDTYFMIEDDAGSALLATGEGFGPFALEWFPKDRGGTHLRADDELKRDEVLAAMLDYFRGASSWRESHAWLEVEDRAPGWLEQLLSGWCAGPDSLPGP